MTSLIVIDLVFMAVLVVAFAITGPIRRRWIRAFGRAYDLPRDPFFAARLAATRAEEAAVVRA